MCSSSSSSDCSSVCSSWSHSSIFLIVVLFFIVVIKFLFFLALDVNSYLLSSSIDKCSFFRIEIDGCFALVFFDYVVVLRTDSGTRQLDWIPMISNDSRIPSRTT